MKEFSQTNSLDGLKKPADYQTAHSGIFPSQQALAWFMRRHRGALIQSRALVTVNRRVLIDTPKFNSAVLRIGAAMTKPAVIRRGP